jgi:uncharacterized cupin superfamily protein
VPLGCAGRRDAASSAAPVSCGYERGLRPCLALTHRTPSAKRHPEMSPDPPIAHWDDVESRRNELGHLAASWRDLGRAAGTVTVGLKRVEIDPGKWSTPAHVEGAEEEIVYVLGGSGLSWQNGKVYEIGEGDCIVHAPQGEAHTLRGGQDGLDVLIYGMRVPLQIADLPRADVAWIFPTWTDAGTGDHPWAREVAAGEPEVGDPEPRPASIVNVSDFELEDWVPGGDLGISSTYIARHAGAELTGLNLDVVHPGKRNSLLHCHSAEEEIFVVLEGEGWCLLGEEEHPIRAGHVVARPAGTRVAHSFRAGNSGMRLLIYGTRDPNDMAYFPKSNKIYFRGLGVIGRIEQLDYLEGEI